jgi:hypothetical protein
MSFVSFGRNPSDFFFKKKGLQKINRPILFHKDVIRQFWQEKLSAVFTEMSFVSFGRK